MSFSTGFRAEGGVEMRRAHIGGDLDCDGGRFIAAPDVEALDADLANVGGQVNLGDGFHAEGEVRLINAVVGSDIDCNNGHFLNPTGNALCLDGAAIGRCLRIGADANAPTDKTRTCLPASSRAARSACGARKSIKTFSPTALNSKRRPASRSWPAT